MYVVYVIHDLRNTWYPNKGKYYVLNKPLAFEPECTWIVPGTVDPND